MDYTFSSHYRILYCTAFSWNLGKLNECNNPELTEHKPFSVCTYFKKHTIIASYSYIRVFLSLQYIIRFIHYHRRCIIKYKFILNYMMHQRCITFISIIENLLKDLWPFTLKIAIISLKVYVGSKY